VTKSLLTLLAVGVVSSAMFTAQVADACTGIVLRGEDGTIVRARTLEWGAFDVLGAISVVPPGYEMSSKMPDGSDGLTWTTKYGVVGATILGPDQIIFADGINEAGLSGGLFYLPGFAEYPPYDPANRENSIAPTDFLNYVLTQFATLDEVRAAMDDITVVSVVLKALGFAAPVHFIMTDPAGETIVIEVVDQKMNIHEAPLGVVTNAPTYDWHVTNLRNYLNLSATALPTQTVAETDFAPLGEGSGMLGLPGDFTPPSRFVRAVAFSQSARVTTGGYDTVRESFRILDNFNTPVHAVHDGEEEVDIVSATQWTTAIDFKNRMFYYHTQFNRQVRGIDVKTLDFAAMNGEPVTIPMDPERQENIQMITFGQ